MSIDLGRIAGKEYSKRFATMISIVAKISYLMQWQGAFIIK
jgi:hypothetical protein